MAVIGIGVDAVDIPRVRTAIARTPSLLGRLFTERERATCTSRCGELRMGGLAARFAAKEAVLKAFGGAMPGFRFRDVEVLNDPSGRPVVTLSGGAARHAGAIGVSAIHLSLTTSDQLAVANALIEGTA